MHKFLSLTRVTLKNTVGMISDGKSGSKTTVLLYAVILVCLLPTAGLLYMMFHTTFEAMAMVDQSGSVLAIAFYLSSLITFVFSIFLIPSIFYFSKDGETLLSLPIKPEAILGSKFVVCLLYEYAFTFFVVIPAFAAYADVATISIYFILSSIIILLLLPIFPLVLSVIISILVMRFVPFFKNRDRFNLISGVVTVILAFGLSFSFNSATMSQDPTSLITTLMSGDNSLIELLGYFFPGVPFAGRAIVDGDILHLVIFILITIASLIVCLLLGKAFYFKGLIGFSETSSSRKKLSDGDVAKLSTQKNRVFTYTLKELKSLLRTPMYAMNCLGTSFVFPILMLIMPLITGEALDVGEIPASFIEEIPSFWPYIIIGGIILGIFVSNLNLISSTAISREGSNISFMKYIPMPLEKQLHAKVLSGIIVSIITDVLMIIAFYILLPFLPIWILIVVFLSSLSGVVLGNYLGLYIDVLHPKLVWEQEAAAVKQNMTSFIAMIGSWAVAIFLGVTIYFIPQEYVSFVSVGMFVLMMLCSVLLYKGLAKFANKKFKKYY